jgi:hypothetical protein
MIQISGLRAKFGKRTATLPPVVVTLGDIGAYPTKLFYGSLGFLQLVPDKGNGWLRVLNMTGGCLVVGAVGSLYAVVRGCCPGHRVENSIIVHNILFFSMLRFTD